MQALFYEIRLSRLPRSHGDLLLPSNRFPGKLHSSQTLPHTTMNTAHAESFSFCLSGKSTNWLPAPWEVPCRHSQTFAERGYRVRSSASSLSSSLPPWKKPAWGWGEGSMRASCGSTRTQIQIPRITPILGEETQPDSQTARQLGQLSDQSVIKHETNDRGRR